MPQIIAQIRLTPGASRQQWGDAIDRQLMKVWAGLSNMKVLEARALYRRAREMGSLQDERKMLALDEIILRQTVTLGWRILASELVLFRLSRWSDDPFEPEMFERLGQALAKSVRILSRAELPPLDDPNLRKYRRHAVRELRKLLRKMRVVFRHAGKDPVLRWQDRDYDRSDLAGAVASAKTGRSRSKKR